MEELFEQLSVSYADPDWSMRGAHAKEIVASHAPLPAPRKRYSKKGERKPEKTKTKLRPNYRSRSSRFVEEELGDCPNGEYGDYAS